jgi:hypothetical protein
MVIGNRTGERPGLVRFEHPLQSVVFIAHLIFGHLVSMLCAKHNTWDGGCDCQSPLNSNLDTTETPIRDRGQK